MQIFVAVWHEQFALISLPLPSLLCLANMFGPVGSPVQPPPAKKANLAQVAGAKAAQKGATKRKGKAEEAAWFANYDEDEEEERAASGSNRVQERKLMEAMVGLCLKLDVERAQAHRDRNVVLAMKSNNNLAVKMQWCMEQYKSAGGKAWEKAQEEGEEYMGNPMGKRPVALFRALLFRLAEVCEAEGAVDMLVQKYVEKMMAENSTTDEAAKTRAKERAQRVLSSLVQTGKEASQHPVRTTRCFTVNYTEVGDVDDAEEEAEMTKWVAATPDPQVHALLDEIRTMNLLAPLHIHFMDDFGPRTKEAKAIAKIAFGKGKGKGRGRGLFQRLP